MRKSTALFGLLFSLSACGGAAPEPASAPATPDALPSSTRSGEETYANVDEAERGLRRAEAELRSIFGPPTAGSAAGPQPRSESRPPSPPPPPPPPAPATAPPAGDAQAQDASSCATACKAFTSMTKATETICRLTSQTDERCSRAQRSLEDARSTLRTCVCVAAP
jgi:hypothetical protein